MIDSIPLIINNKPIKTSRIFDVVNPRTGKPIYQCYGASVEIARSAADAANDAFAAWSQTKPGVRRDLMLKAADIYMQRKKELMGYWLEEVGSDPAFGEIIFSMGYGILKDFAGNTAALEGRAPILGREGQSGVVYKTPYGVILSIVPWNAPFPLGLRAIVLPLMAGNTVVLKGSEMAPKSLWGIWDVFREAGLPDGCLNMVFHRPEDASEITTTLISHPAVRKINFTGSTNVGSIVAALAGKYLKPVLLELGGKASAIIRDDAKIEEAANQCVLASFLNSGQICMSTERIIVLRRIAPQFRTALIEAVKRLQSDRPDPSVVLVNAASAVKSKALISNALSLGANVLVGSHTNSQEEDKECAASMQPIVLENVTPQMDIYATESFGPTVSLYVVDSDDEAVALANDTEYGLSAAIFTENLAMGLRVARQLQSGAVHINSMTVHDEASLPHGGIKCSGYGRFGGAHGLDEFLSTKSVTWMD
ncbi:hypothetical protein FQN57_005912 [Myotisia sp. PD_48]|nr:hypothetical protein FQN57_005912 [Myotisia sp. PD_48]